MAKNRKKPVIIETIQWNGSNFDEVSRFTGDWHGNKIAHEDAEERAIKTGNISIRTSEGVITARKGNYIIKGVDGMFSIRKGRDMKIKQLFTLVKIMR